MWPQQYVNLFIGLAKSNTELTMHETNNNITRFKSALVSLMVASSWECLVDTWEMSRNLPSTSFEDLIPIIIKEIEAHAQDKKFEEVCVLQSHNHQTFLSPSQIENLQNELDHHLLMRKDLRESGFIFETEINPIETSTPFANYELILRRVPADERMTENFPEIKCEEVTH